MPGHRISGSLITSSEGDSVWQLDWDYPDPLDETMQLEVDVSIASTPDRHQFSLSLARESTSFRVAPSPFEVKRPYLVYQVARDYRCVIDGKPVEPVATALDATSIPRFVRDELLSKSRALPIVLLTRPNLGLEFPVNPNQLADQLSGLAHVYVIPDRTATYVLTDNVGRELGCFDGGVRVYWPGLALDGNPRNHPLYLAASIERIRAEGKSLESVLLNRLAAAASLRFGSPPVATRIQREAADESERKVTEELDGLRSKLGQQGVSKETLLERLHALEFLDRERSKRVRSLEAEVRRLQSSRSGGRTGGPTEVEPAQPEAGEAGYHEPQVRSVVEAVTRGRTDFEDYLEFLRSAIESAERSRSRRSRDVYRALEAIREVAYDYFVGEDARTGLGEPLERAFRRRGFHFKPKDSATTTGKFGAQRTFQYDGKPTLFEMHLTIGGGDRQDPVQVYFLIDPAKRKFVIGYCGMHLEIVRGAS